MVSSLNPFPAVTRDRGNRSHIPNGNKLATKSINSPMRDERWDLSSLFMCPPEFVGLLLSPGPVQAFIPGQSHSQSDIENPLKPRMYLLVYLCTYCCQSRTHIFMSCHSLQKKKKKKGNAWPSILLRIIRKGSFRISRTWNVIWVEQKKEKARTTNRFDDT